MSPFDAVDRHLEHPEIADFVLDAEDISPQTITAPEGPTAHAARLLDAAPDPKRAARLLGRSMDPHTLHRISVELALPHEAPDTTAILDLVLDVHPAPASVIDAALSVSTGDDETYMALDRAHPLVTAALAHLADEIPG